MSDRREPIPCPLHNRLDYGEQDENGVDLSLIREALKLTPQQRLRYACEAADGMMQLREHARRTPAGEAGAGR